LGLVDVYTYLDFLVIRVEKVLTGTVSGNYVRADFLGGTYENLPKSLFDGKPWKMKLEPAALQPNHYKTCDWTIRPNPPPDSLEPHWWPRMVAVGGTKSFPDPNTLYCYAIKRDNVQEIAPNNH
jgi:hypothetical protein